MDNASIKNVKKEGLFTGLGTSMGAGAVMTGGFGSISAIRRHKGIGNAIAKTHHTNAIINEFLKKSNITADSFTKAYSAAVNYEEYNRILKNAQKAKKVLTNVQSGKISIWQRLTNIGKSSDEIIAKYAKESTDASDALKNAFSELKSGKEIARNKVLAGSLKQNAKGLFKEELLNPINLIYAIGSTANRIKMEAIPVFKEKGLVAGIKQTGVCILKSMADVVSNAGFSAAFRMIGNKIGLCFGPAGAAVGGIVGDMLGTFISNKIITYAFGENKQNDNQSETQNETGSKQMEQQTETSNTPSNPQAISSQQSNKPLAHLQGQALVDYANKVQEQANAKGRIKKEIYA